MRENIVIVVEKGLVRKYRTLLKNYNFWTARSRLSVWIKTKFRPLSLNDLKFRILSQFLLKIIPLGTDAMLKILSKEFKNNRTIISWLKRQNIVASLGIINFIIDSKWFQEVFKKNNKNAWF